MCVHWFSETWFIKYQVMQQQSLNGLTTFELVEVGRVVLSKFSIYIFTKSIYYIIYMHFNVWSWPLRMLLRHLPGLVPVEIQTKIK